MTELSRISPQRLTGPNISVAVLGKTVGIRYEGIPAYIYKNKFEEEMNMQNSEVCVAKNKYLGIFSLTVQIFKTINSHFILSKTELEKWHSSSE